ncbi:hypothetical protein CP02DC14_2215B, partial [Chlamydia psittaci 02DC14]
SSFSF